jgi:hypothetical protein
VPWRFEKRREHFKFTKEGGVDESFLDFRSEARQNFASVGQHVGSPPTTSLFTLTYLIG